MTMNLRFLIGLLAMIMLVSLSVPTVQADWYYSDAKSQIAASLLAENMSAMK